MVSMPDRATRAYSFGTIAEDYDRYRPGPPLEAARWVLGEGRQRVVDLGAGTGGLTRALVQLAPGVIGVEPDTRMRSVLARRSGGATLVGAVGERLPFADRTADGVLASSSWHWMDSATGGAEVARVLRVGGVFGLLWSGPDRQVPWVGDLFGRRPSSALGSHPGFGHRRTMELPDHLPFSAPEMTVIRFCVTVGVDDLAGLSGTYSVAIVGGDPARRARIDAVRERARARLAMAGDAVELPMACRCWRTFRIEGRPADR